MIGAVSLTSVLGMLLALLVFCVVVWAARAIMAAFSMPAPIQTIVTVAIVLVFVFWLVGVLGGTHLRGI